MMQPEVIYQLTLPSGMVITSPHEFGFAHFELSETQKLKETVVKIAQDVKIARERDKQLSREVRKSAKALLRTVEHGKTCPWK